MSGGSDFNDLASSQGPDAVRAAIEGATPASDRAPTKKIVPFRGQHPRDEKKSVVGVSDPGDLPTIAPGELPTIVFAPGELPAIVDQAEAAVISLDGEPRVYQRGGSMVRIIRRGPTSARNIKRSAGALAIVPIEAPYLVELMTAAAIWLKPGASKAGAEHFRVINAPKDVAAVLLARGAWNFPPLTGVVEAPTLRPDGSVLFRPGYDQATGLYLDVGDACFDVICEHPDAAASVAGLEQIAEMLSEFPFSSDVDRSVAIASILTGLVGMILPSRPLFGFSATVMGSGKTYLAHVVSLLATGRPAAVIAPPKDAKEEDKTLFSSLLEGDPILVYDNIEHQLSSDLLCAVLTSEILRGRVLGSSKTASVSTACTFIATGNNLTIAGDLSARALVCRLDPKSDHPEHRRFSRDLTHWIPLERGRLVPAALTFLRGYLNSNTRPDMEPWQRFPEWDRLIRAAIVWAGYPDPLLALRQGEAGDPRRLEHQAVMEAWAEVFGDKPTSAREAVKAADSQSLIEDYRLRDALLDVAGERGEVNSRRLGRWLLKMRGRIQGGLAIDRGGVVRGQQTWVVRP